MGNFVIGFRESIEAILLIILILGVIKELDRLDLRKYLIYGVIGGIVLSVLVGLGIHEISSNIREAYEKGWEALSSLIASVLVISVVYFMIKNSKNISSSIKEKTKSNLRGIGIFLLSLFMVAREGFEIVLFVAASPDSENIFLFTGLGIAVGILIGILLYFSIIKINIQTLFKVTLFYLILQAGYLFGYAIHEFLEVLELNNVLINSNFIHGRLYDLSETFLNQKESIFGLFLNVVFGWTSKPHILQFIGQYLVTIILFITYKNYNKNEKNKNDETNGNEKEEVIVN